MYQTILVNKTHPLKEKELKKIELVKAINKDEKEILVEKDTLLHFKKLQSFLKKQGIEIEIDSSYRTVEEQKEIEEKYLKKYGKSYCNHFVAPPTTSEHHTGLAIDFYIKKDGCFPKDDKEVIENPKDYEEIHKVLKDYGFILRFPKGKEEITGYSYEPWHIRYVGDFVAKIITEQQITLEEYVKSFQGIMIINKKRGMTSFDVVNKISKLFGIKKVGHTGTLDPLAEGVLIVCIGEATKVVELLTLEDKEYIAKVKLGIETDTYDIEGKVLEEQEIPKNIDYKSVLSKFQKTYLQEVPIYSAVKVHGKKLYEYARKQEEVELPKKEVTIKEIELLDQNEEEFTFKAKVSKGCYIRSLIHDITKEMNTIGIMTSLVRTKQGNVSIKNSNTLEDIENGNYKLYSIEEVILYPKVVVDKELEFQIKNGCKIKNNWKIKDKVLFKNEEGKYLGIYEVEEDYLKVWKNFAT